MARANRCFLPGHVWHLTQRCHKKEFLLKFERDRRRWMHWLGVAKRRYGLCVLNYVVTSNHVHLVVLDRGRGEIASSMQLVAGRLGQEFNGRKKRKGAFWEDRYHATAIDRTIHLSRCLRYVDLNMVRAGVVNDPAEWWAGGYRELLEPPRRYRIVDDVALVKLLGARNIEQVRRDRSRWVAEDAVGGALQREACWSECLAVGSRAYVESIKAGLGVRGAHRSVEARHDGYQLRETAPAYNVDFGAKSGALSLPGARI